MDAGEEWRERKNSFSEGVSAEKAVMISEVWHDSMGRGRRARSAMMRVPRGMGALANRPRPLPGEGRMSRRWRESWCWVRWMLWRVRGAVGVPAGVASSMILGGTRICG